MTPEEYQVIIKTTICNIIDGNYGTAINNLENLYVLLGKNTIALQQ